ncbi:MAG: ComF family protein [Bdellovibrionales bacterium]
MTKLLLDFPKSVLDFLLPARCVVTGEIVESSEVLSPEAWSLLNFIDDPMCRVCGVPFEFSDMDEREDAEGLTCGSCLDYPPVFERARVALRYDDGSRGLVLAYKHGDKTHMALPFSAWIEKAGKDILAQADLLVPVPLHWTRLVKRRYNQAGLLAQCLSKRVGVPVDTLHLKRVRKTLPQGHMKMEARRKNVKGAFTVLEKDRARFDDKNIVLIDDVYTTGVTVNECARVLLEAGAKSVQVLCVARTVYD